MIGESWAGRLNAGDSSMRSAVRIRGREAFDDRFRSFLLRVNSSLETDLAMASDEFARTLSSGGFLRVRPSSSDMLLSFVAGEVGDSTGLVLRGGEFFAGFIAFEVEVSSRGRRDCRDSTELAVPWRLL